MAAKPETEVARPTPDARERIRRYGREAFIQEEMLRLGFWPPHSQAAANRQEALAALQVTRAELVALRQQLAGVEQHIADVTDIAGLLVEIRKKRIERVRLQREQRKIEKAQAQAAHHEADKLRRQRTPPFLGRGVSGGLRFEGGDAARLTALGLPLLETASDLAAAIGIGEGTLAWLTYDRATATIDHYHRFMIPKRTGGTRHLSSPKRTLRTAQSWLLANVLAKIELHNAAMGFRPGRSILDNANLHQNRAIVIRIDLKDFFPSIGFGRVKGLFQAFGYNEGVAILLALLSTEAPRVPTALDGVKRFVAIGARQLPQGACTSPAITNILCRKLDKRLTGLAHSANFIYTRYADDCVFSTDNAACQLGAFLHPLRQIIKEEGFVVKEEKTLVMRPQNRQTVTGLVVNEKPSISRQDLRSFRAFLHHCETEGLEAVSQRQARPALSYARGYLAFIQMVSPDKASQLRQVHPWLAH